MLQSCGTLLTADSSDVDHVFARGRKIFPPSVGKKGVCRFLFVGTLGVVIVVIWWGTANRDARVPYQDDRSDFGACRSTGML